MAEESPSERTERLEDETEQLRRELEEFKQEKEKIRGLVGQIGGSTNNLRERLLHWGLISAVAGLLTLDVIREIWHPTWIIWGSMLSLEIGVLLVSLKVIWMLHKQQRVEHFQFWILNSIEFRLNDIVKRLRGLEGRFPDDRG